MIPCLLTRRRCDQLDGDPKEVSPIFTQFLECVWQLTEQFPQVRGSVVRCRFRPPVPDVQARPMTDEALSLSFLGL